MKPQLKLYYLMQASFWAQQLLILLLRLEKPRKDYYELVCHHFVTIWLIGYAVRDDHSSGDSWGIVGGATSST